MVSLTSEQLNNRAVATRNYLTAEGNEDLLAGARAYAKSLGIPSSNVGGTASAMSNYAVGHYLARWVQQLAAVRQVYRRRGMM